jgi:hypothetical protein
MDLVEILPAEQTHHGIALRLVDQRTSLGRSPFPFAAPADLPGAMAAHLPFSYRVSRETGSGGIASFPTPNNGTIPTGLKVWVSNTEVANADDTILAAPESVTVTPYGLCVSG